MFGPGLRHDSKRQSDHGAPVRPVPARTKTIMNDCNKNRILAAVLATFIALPSAISFAQEAANSTSDKVESQANQDTAGAVDQSNDGAADGASEAAEAATTELPKSLSQADQFRAMALTSKAFRKATEKIMPSLVTIESFGGVGAVQGRIGGIRKQGEGNTTGILISEDGYILTSTFNFIQQPPVITVITSDGQRRFATVMGRDDTRKLCLLKIMGVSEMPVPEIVDLKKIKVGQWVVSLGVGYGDVSPAVSMGIISAKNRIGGRAIQTDANISPANYGGALVDIEGRLMGICVPMNPQSQAISAGVEWYDSGIGFAVPLSGLEKLIQRLKDGERIRPAFLGIEAFPNPSGDGLRIKRVLEYSPADESELKAEDLILELNGTPVNDMLKLRQILNKFEAGIDVEMTVMRSGEKEKDKFKMTLGTPPKPKDAPEQLEPPKIR